MDTHSQNLTLTFIQESIVWQDPAANRRRFGELINEAVPASDLILLPEMFTTGFAQESAQHAETMEGETLEWMISTAKKAEAHIAGSLAIRENGHVYNRLVWVRDDGQVETYDKRHLFSFAGEHKAYRAGSARKIIECKGWRCCPQVCYDLRFPVWSRNDSDYDLLIYLANWPKVRVRHWSQLLPARAIENLSYVVGVNRVGDDGHGYPHNGQSVALNPKGLPLVEPGSKAGCYTVSLDRVELSRYREKFGALQDRDRFSVHTD